MARACTCAAVTCASGRVSGASCETNHMLSEAGHVWLSAMLRMSPADIRAASSACHCQPARAERSTLSAKRPWPSAMA